MIAMRRGIMKAQQRGTTLLELLIVALIMTSVILGAASLIDNMNQTQRLTATAQHMRQFATAAQAYVKDNYMAVQANATTTTSCVITLGDLQSGASATKYLPAGFSATNSYGQTISALVLQPLDGTLSTLIVTTGGLPPADPANPDINDIDLAHIAGLLGASGGGIYRSNVVPANAPLAVGTMGKWVTNLTSSPITLNGTLYNPDSTGPYFKQSTRHCVSGAAAGVTTLEPGHPVMALWFSGDTSSAYLYRNQVPGQDKLNTMYTNLKFDPFSSAEIQELNIYKDNAGAIPGTAKLAEPCGYNGSYRNPGGDHPMIAIGTLTRDGNGSILSCQYVNTSPALANVPDNRTWQGPLYWGEPVDTYADLETKFPCSGTTYKWQSRVVRAPNTSLDPQLVLFGDPLGSPGRGPRAYTCDGTTWQALAANKYGVMELGTAMKEGAGWGCDPVYKGQMSMNKEGVLMTCQTNPSISPLNPSPNIWIAVGTDSSTYYEFDIDFGANPDLNAGYASRSLVGSGKLIVSMGDANTGNAWGKFTGTLWCNPGNAAVPPTWMYDDMARAGQNACGSGGRAVLTGINPDFAAYRYAFGINDLEHIRWWWYNNSTPGSWDHMYGYSAAPNQVGVKELKVKNAKKIW